MARALRAWEAAQFLQLQALLQQLPLRLQL
jgi:hypothetical protein